MAITPNLAVIITVTNGFLNFRRKLQSQFASINNRNKQPSSILMLTDIAAQHI